MNIFILDTDPVEAARQQCDKHIVKMPLESAQMLSTAHRVLDGKLTRIPSKSGKTMVKHWKLDRDDDIIYKAVHVSHPCTLWTMESEANYYWHYRHFIALSIEFQYRYGKEHGSWTLLKDVLATAPRNIDRLLGLTPFRLAMGAAPECINESDPVSSYRSFYQTKQDRFKMAWSKRDVPEWFQMAA